MSPSESIHGVEARYALYGLDAEARGAIKRMWPTIAPYLESAVDAILDATENLPAVSAIAKKHRALIKQLELSHLKALLNGELDAPYFESCRETVEQEATLGFDARLRSTAGNYVLRAAIDALARKHRFAPGKLAESTKLLSQAIAFDVANAMTLHREKATKAVEVRRTKIDEAIADFGSAIGDDNPRTAGPASDPSLRCAVGLQFHALCICGVSQENRRW